MKEEKRHITILSTLRKKTCIFSFLFFLVVTLQASSKAKIALIFGITGQDGFYLTELLLSKNYIIHGMIRSTPSQLEHIRKQRKEVYKKRFFLHHGDLTDTSNIVRLVDEVSPDEIYNLGAQSHVQVSFTKPEYTANCDALGPLRILEAIRILGRLNKTRFYQASSSEMFGDAEKFIQNEETPFASKSPYATAKLFGYWITKNYREAYGVFACNGILFNHESERRGKDFVTRKITRAVTKIACKRNKILRLGNLDAKRDWGYAPDYVEAMWLMLQQDKPDDYVVATGETHTVREFVELAFKEIGVELIWEGQGVSEKGIDKKTKKILVQIDSKFFRPIDKPSSLGNSNKAKKILGWAPKTKFKALVHKMVESELQEFKRV